ncbi:ECF transporter S component [Romboutsia weinsteinii]|uniref:ECF transporter S component n=1 Tax=Romboutsia weinsteinii TaxID=2020949 RepID=A0A371J883_9FIRM|nr:CD3073 family putative ECF transporter S component [Romboutsia weinsteinii]RDY28990.1 ECF transporter S component [Romboutsia weinsteinii]
MKTRLLTFSAICIVLNVVVGMTVQMINIPILFLDTIGTIIGSLVLGPWYGAAIGGCTNLVLGVISGPTNIPFALVNIILGLVVGFISRKNSFSYKTAILTGIALAVICPLIGTPISVLVFGGLSGSGADILVGFLMQSGQKIFTSAFIPRILTNIIDKPLSCIIALFLISRLPNSFVNDLKLAKSK